VSKRTRGSSRAQHRRPGARPASQRSAARRRDTGVPRAEAAPISPLADDQPLAAPATGEVAGSPSAQERRGLPAAQPRQRIKPGSLLAARAATEYVYVAQDLKRIGVVGGLLFGTLFVLWLVIVVWRVIPLPFY
jgi:hypothetical protein